MNQNPKTISNYKNYLSYLIEHLPTNKQTILSLYYVDKLSVEEISQVLDLSRDGAAALLNSAINELLKT